MCTVMLRKANYKSTINLSWYAHTCIIPLRTFIEHLICPSIVLFTKVKRHDPYFQIQSKWKLYKQTERCCNS